MNRVQVYRLADTLQADLKEEQRGMLSGSVTFALHDLPSMRVPMEVAASFTNLSETGIMVRVLGKLHMMLVVAKDDSVVGYLIDSDKLGVIPNRKIKPFNQKNATADQWLSTLAGSIVKEFRKAPGLKSTWVEVEQRG